MIKMKIKTTPTKPPKPKREPTTAERLDAIGIDAICERIEDGETFKDIATSLQMSMRMLGEWLGTNENAPHSARAREASAEAWLDKGLATIATSLSKSGDVDVGAARAYAQECARRASIRNPRYRDKVDMNHGGQTDNPIQIVERVIVKIK
jgi:hypothetical protein